MEDFHRRGPQLFSLVFTVNALGLTAMPQVGGSTENATLVTGLITGLRERGLDVTKPILAVLDGAKALSRAAARHGRPAAARSPGRG
jgi:hypothetical protein